MAVVRDFFGNEQGVAAIHYAIIASTIGLAVLIGGLGLGGSLGELYESFGTDANSALVGNVPVDP